MMRYARFVFLAEVLIKIQVFRDVTLYQMFNDGFGGK